MTGAVVHPEAHAGLLRRLWLYQAERFPLGKTALLLAAFSASSISLSAHLAGRPLPPWWVFVAAWIVAVIFLFQLRACDEYKDLEDDRLYRPERPIPSGLVSLRTILALAGIAALAAVALTLAISPALLLPLALVWLWLALMTAEFFVPDWLRARPFLYLVSHMGIMAFIDLYLTGAEWIRYGWPPPLGMWVYLALSLVNGCVLEIGRKTWAPESERVGVETYSSLLGPARSAQLWLAVGALAWLLLLCIGFLVGAPLTIGGLSAILLLVLGYLVLNFVRRPSPSGQKRIDGFAGIWVLACYLLAGGVPLLPEGLTP